MLSHDVWFQPSPVSAYTDIRIEDLVNVSTLAFPLDLPIPVNSPLTTVNGKPTGDVMWWSPGTQVYDPYCETRCCDHYDQLDHVTGFIIINPVNVLTVDSTGALDVFVKEWVTLEDRWNPQINWNGIREAGYYGVKFPFRKVYDLERKYLNKIKMFKPTYDWHSSYHVESLITWDSRAYHVVYPVRLIVSHSY